MDMENKKENNNSKKILIVGDSVINQSIITKLQNDGHSIDDLEIISAERVKEIYGRPLEEEIVKLKESEEIERPNISDIIKKPISLEEPKSGQESRRERRRQERRKKRK